jgi:hypothetical protein
MDRRASPRITRGLAPVLLLFGFGALLVAGLPWPCPFLAITGLPCPTCGITRAARLALHGDFAGAFRMHPLFAPILAACMALAVAELISYRRTGLWGEVLERRPVRWSLSGLALVTLLVWLARFAGAFGGPAAHAAISEHREVVRFSSRPSDGQEDEGDVRPYVDRIRRRQRDGIGEKRAASQTLKRKCTTSPSRMT